MINHHLLRIIRKQQKPMSLDLLSILQYRISCIADEKNLKDINFLCHYYGLIGKAKTLEAIGNAQQSPITRERVRQIAEITLNKLLAIKSEPNLDPFSMTAKLFKEILGNKKFISVKEVAKHSYFKNFFYMNYQDDDNIVAGNDDDGQNNLKGFIAFFNDCGIRQIAYRRKYYFYLGTPENSRYSMIQLIQNENKTIRRGLTEEKMKRKAKTVTYVPNEVREFINQYTNQHDMSLNPFYEKMLMAFIKDKCYESEDFNFSRTKSWKARKGTAQWHQIGIYINIDIFKEVQKEVSRLKKGIHKNASIMNFICQSFVWYYQKFENQTS